MSVVIQSGMTKTELTVDAVSKTFRGLQYTSLGGVLGRKRTAFSGNLLGSTLVNSTPTTLWWILSGISGHVVKMHRVYGYYVLNAGSIYYNSIVLEKRNGASIGTTPTATPATQGANFDSTLSRVIPPVSFLYSSTQVPGEGYLVGTLGVRRFVLQAGSPVGGGLPVECDLDYRAGRETEPPTLNGPEEQVAMSIQVSEANLVYTVTCWWTSEVR